MSIVKIMGSETVHEPNAYTVVCLLDSTAWSMAPPRVLRVGDPSLCVSVSKDFYNYLALLESNLIHLLVCRLLRFLLRTDSNRVN